MAKWLVGRLLRRSFQSSFEATEWIRMSIAIDYLLSIGKLHGLMYRIELHSKQKERMIPFFVIWNWILLQYRWNRNWTTKSTIWLVRSEIKMKQILRFWIRKRERKNGVTCTVYNVHATRICTNVQCTDKLVVSFIIPFYCTWRNIYFRFLNKANEILIIIVSMSVVHINSSTNLKHVSSIKWNVSLNFQILKINFFFLFFFDELECAELQLTLYAYFFSSLSSEILIVILSFKFYHSQ